MKKLSKLLCALLTVLMLTGTTLSAPVTISADTAATETATYTTEQRCRIGFAEYFGCDTKFELNDDLTKYAIYGTSGDCTVFRRVPSMMFPVECEQIIGDYKSVSSSMFGPNDNPTAMYVLKPDNTVTSLIKAYEEGIVDMAEVAAITPADSSGYIVPLSAGETPDISTARTLLEEAIRDAETIFMESKRYTPESLDNLERRLKSARNVLANERSSYDSLVAAKTTLEYAVNSLVPAVTDKAELEALLGDIDKYIEAKDKYTPESYAAFDSAKEQAIVQLYMGNDQAEIDRAVTALKSAIAGLRLKDEPEYTLDQLCRIGYAVYLGLDVQEMLSNTKVEYHIYGTTQGDLTLFRLFSTEGVAYPCVLGEQTIGDYLFATPYPYGPNDNPIGLYVMISKSTVNSLSGAYAAGDVSDEDMAEIFDLLKEKDKDGSVVYRNIEQYREAKAKLLVSINNAKAILPKLKDKGYSDEYIRDFQGTVNYSVSVYDNELTSLEKVVECISKLNSLIENTKLSDTLDLSALREAIARAEKYTGKGDEYSNRTYTRLTNNLIIAKAVLTGGTVQGFINKVAEDLNKSVDSLRAPSDNETEEIELCCKEGYAKLCGSSTEDELSDEVTYEFFGKVTNGYVFRRMGLCSTADGYDYIGDYVSFSGNIYGDDNNRTGIYVLDEYDSVFDLRTAAEKGIVSMEAVAWATRDSENGVVRLVGDADNEGGLTIKDATFIQKFLAGFKEENEALSSRDRYIVCDMNRDQTVNIKDATAIQRLLVGLD